MKRALFAAGIALLCGAAAVYDSRCHLQTSEYTVESSVLPRGLDGLKIVHLSDLHGGVFGRDNGRLAALVKAQKPDIVALTGDFATRRAELGAVESLLKGLQGQRMYFVRGNHEWVGGLTVRMQALMEKYGVQCVEDSAKAVEINGERLVVAGADDPAGKERVRAPGKLAEEIRARFPDDFILWLGHRNYWVKEFPLLPVNLILAGHAHGGIIRLPFVGGILNNEHRFGAEYDKGAYKSGSYTMIVSRGLGNSIFVPRLFNRPEIVSVTLKAE